MRRFRKMVWKEGMFITPHHFQQWDRYHEAVTDYRQRVSSPFSWGVLDLEIDTDALLNENVVVTTIHAIFADGTVVHAPEIDELPPARPLSGLSQPIPSTIEIFLGIPLEKEGQPNYAFPGDVSGASRLFRYHMDNVAVQDLVLGENEKELMTARKNLQLLFSGEILDDFEKIKIAEIGRNAAGEYVVMPSYIPPCLGMESSARLKTILRGLLEALSAKSRSLSAQRREKSSGAVEFGVSEITHFWLLHTINGIIPILAHFLRHSRLHPECLYRELARLIGQLLTFASQGMAQEIIPYVHDNLGETFDKIDSQIRDLLEIVIPANWVQIPLEKTKPTTWIGRISDERIFSEAAFLLTVKSDISEARLRDTLPKKIKIGALNDIDTIINAALQGIEISHTTSPPGALPVKLGHQYFRLDHHGEFWESIRQSRTIAIYIPAEFGAIHIELIAVKE